MSPRRDRRRGGSDAKDTRRGGLGTPAAAGPINITPDPAVLNLSTVDPIVVLSPINITPDPAVLNLSTVDPTVRVSAGQIINAWLRVNGVDVENSNVIKTVGGNDVLSLDHMLSLQKNDYCELMFSVESLSMYFNATATTPATPSVLLNVEQIK